MTLAEAYKLVSDVASPSDSEGLKKPRAILLLWFLRHVYGIDDLEAYEFICDGTEDQGVDALYVESGDQDEDKERLLLFQSTYPESPKNVGITEIQKLIGVAEPFRSAEALEALLKKGVESELERLIRNYDLVEKIREGRIELRLVFVTSGKLTPEARALVATTNANRGLTLITAHDVLDLAPTVEAFRSPKTVSASITVNCGKDRFVCDMPNGRVAVCRVPVKDIIAWPGIDDRTLFDLNVRRELGRNQVRKALDRAVQRKADHPNFIAYHNGLTVVCRRIDSSFPESLKIEHLSVVNGAQSTIAFKDNALSVTDELAVVVKFVEVPAEKQLAREVAIRSNTQNPVNPRNLRARDGIQLRLVEEFKKNFPGTTYEIRPDATIAPAGHTIQNDDAAQLLCAVYNAAPWIAIRRLSLFEAERYPSVFTPTTTAAHVLFVDLIATAVQEAKTRFPKEYLRSWRLTKLVAVYLVGQLLRTSAEFKAILKSPAEAMKDKPKLRGIIDRLVRFAAATLKTRNDEKARTKELDDFKVDFKRENALRELAGKARDTYLTYATVEED